MSPLIFQHTHRVTYADCTVGNHVYYARYLDFIETARGEFFRHLGLTFQKLQEQGIIFPVVKAELRYRAPARYDDALTVELQVERAERVRLDFAYRILGPAGRLLVEACTEHVCTGLTDRPQRLPVELLAHLGPYSLDSEPPCK